MPPFCSIIIPAYNAARYVDATLRSVRSQTRGDWEAIVVDDGSTDATADIVDAFCREEPRARLVRQSNEGLAAARNAGLAASDTTTPFVLFLDADDLLLPGALAALVDAALAAPNSPAAHGGARYIDADGRQLPDPAPHRRDRLGFGPDGRVAPTPAGMPTRQDVFAIDNCITSAGQVLIRREALAATGGFDAEISPLADHDMWSRLIWDTGRPLACVQDDVLAYRVHPSSMSRNVGVMQAARARMRLKHFRAARTGGHVERLRVLRRGQRHADALRLAEAVTGIRRAMVRRDLANLPSAFVRFAYAAVKRIVPISWTLHLSLRRHQE